VQGMRAAVSERRERGDLLADSSDVGRRASRLQRGLSVSIADRRPLEVSLRVGAVSALHVVLYAALLWAAVAAGKLPAGGEPWRVPGSLVLLALLNSCLVSYLVLRSRWTGRQLTVAVGAVFYAGHSVLQQLDSVAFPHVSPLGGELPASPFGLNALFTLLFVPLAVAILNAGDAPSAQLDAQAAPTCHLRAVALKVALGVVLHQIVFVAVGYWIAREGPSSLADSSAVISEFQRVVSETPWLPGLQVFRALIWIGLSLPVVYMLRGPPWETSLVLGSLWALLGSGELVMRGSHSLDFLSRAHMHAFSAANFVAGALLGALLLWRTAAGPTRAGGE
jgi:putative effector of murein hydrolase LrgA (UPF0299 family)